MSIAENRKELSRRLNFSKRQFFQWHYRERRPIREVKEKMDKLSYYLGKISDYDFRADEDKWKYRERIWNKEWAIKKYDRGLHQPTPENISHLPIWQTEHGDVGDWRAAASAVKDESHPTSPCAEQDTQVSQSATGFGIWNARAEIAQWSNTVTALNNIHPPMLPYEDPETSIQYRSQAYREPYEPNHTTVPTLATCTTSDGHSTTEAGYTPNIRNPNQYDGENAEHIQTPCSPLCMDFDPLSSHIHGFLPQPSRVPGQGFTYGTQKTGMSAQSPSIRSNNLNLRSYEGYGAAESYEGSQSFY